MCAIFVERDGELVEMVEQPYVAETDLQGHLAAHPELLRAEAAEDERRRWLLVRREMGVADREGGTDRWGLDHLFVDQDAIPTFVEVKRSSDTRLRREVVGQMLDYAANASAHWDAGRLRSSFESRFADAEAATDELLMFIEDDLEPMHFWETVAANLGERRLRLVFVADRIPPELRSIVEFLNEQLQLTEVIAVEIKKYVEPDGERVNIIPRIIGETEMARRVKRTGGGARADVLGDGGGIAVNMKEFRTRRTSEEMARLVSLLRQPAGTSEALDKAVAKDYRTFCTLPADRVLATDEDLEAFKRVLDEAAVRTPTVA